MVAGPITTTNDAATFGTLGEVFAGGLTGLFGVGTEYLRAELMNDQAATEIQRLRNDLQARETVLNMTAEQQRQAATLNSRMLLYVGAGAAVMLGAYMFFGRKK